ncbi:hypothetical protein AABM38_09515 [Heyndrickxia sp. MSNUG]
MGKFDIPYVYFEGRKHLSIREMAVVADCVDKVDRKREAEARGIEA